MKQIISKFKPVKWFMLVALCATLFSFSSKVGGDSFEIYLNNKLLLQQRVLPKASVASLTLDRKDANDQVAVRYSHCGQLGKSRSLTIKDDHNKVLKEWHFIDEAPMVCSVKDIIQLTSGNKTLNLFYSSKELPEGRLLASIAMAKDSRASL